MKVPMEPRPYAHNFEHLADELRWLDRLIQLRICTLTLLNHSKPETQASRAVYITPAEVEWLLDDNREPPQKEDDVAAKHAELIRQRTEIDARLALSRQAGCCLALPQLGKLFGLSFLEMAAVVICLAPEMRRKYDRLYAYLQDDITRKRPSVDLVLELLCDADAQRWHARRIMADSGPLMRGGILQKIEDSTSPSGSSSLSQILKLDRRICEFLLGNNQVDARLFGKARLYQPSEQADFVPVDAHLTAAVDTLVNHHTASAATGNRKLVLYLHGPRGVGKRELALHVCGRLGTRLLSIDMEALLALGPESESLMRLAFCEALLQQAGLFLERADVLFQGAARPVLNAVAVAVAEYGWLTILGGESPCTVKDPFPGCVFHAESLPIPDASIRTVVWKRCLEGRVSDVAEWAAQLADRFQLTAGQITSAAQLAENRSRMRGQDDAITLADLADACRRQSNHKLRELAIKVETCYDWAELVLPDDKIVHLREVCAQLRNQYRVFHTWGFGSKIRLGKGLSAMFTGPSGTGKTMAAQVVARDLSLDLYKVDLSRVLSKYIGETEKNLARIFDEGETSNAILFFDEADALFGKRTEVTDSHDRYANIETSYLLQKIDEYQGIVILATNLRENMDDAFTRRIRFVIEFPFPDEVHRARIWEKHFPAEAPVAAGIDFNYLGRELQIAGGNVRNIVLNAAFLAASDGGTINLEHILQGSKREFEKLGKLWKEQRP